ncbi:MAG TPA: O-antigen ligase family protein, partial [Solirubrobacteraceae bacterium]|nr:O-antigen ligase family protein [Solirubrobacteraceae bacterium]
MGSSTLTSRIGRSVTVGEVALGLAVGSVAAAAAVTGGARALALPLALALVAFALREPVALLALFLVIGLFKDEALVRALPVDATLAAGALLALVCGVRLVTGRIRAVPLGLSLAISVVCLSLVASLAWTSAPTYGEEKVTTFLTLTLLAIGAPFFIFEQWDDVRRFFAWTVVIATPVAILAISNPAQDTGRLAGDNTIGTSRLLCMAALIVLLGALGSARWRAPRVVLAVGFVAIAAAVGSRGPILSFALALAVTLAAWLLRAPRKVAPVLVVAALSVAVVPFVSLPATSSERLAEAARDPIAAFRENDRHFLAQQAIDLIERAPLRGAGVGAFSTVNPTVEWPHNLFLELWAELGLAAVLVVAAAITAVLAGLFRTAWRLPERMPEHELAYALLAVFVFNLLAVQVSGNINDNRVFWGTLALASLVAAGGL